MNLGDSAYDDPDSIGSDDPDHDLFDDEAGETDTITCPSCGARIYEETQQCPHCGDWVVPRVTMGRRRPVFLAIVLLMVLLILIFALW